MAFLAADASQHMALMSEVNEVGYSVNSLPLDDRAFRQDWEERLDFGRDRGLLFVFLHEPVAALATGHRWNPGHGSSLGVGMARDAADSVLAGVHFVTELDGLFRRHRALAGGQNNHKACTSEDRDAQGLPRSALDCEILLDGLACGDGH